MANGASGALIGGLFGFGTELLRSAQAKKTQTRFRRRQRAAIGEARKFADESVSRVTSSPLFSQASQFLESTFGAPEDSPLVNQFRKSLQTSQASRGLFFGGAPAAAEAGGIAVASQQLRQSLLPNILNFTFQPEQLRQSVLDQESRLRVAAATGAPLIGLPEQAVDPLGNALQSAISGAAGGFQLGQQFGGQQQQGGVDGTRDRRAPVATAGRLQQQQGLGNLSQARQGQQGSLEALQALQQLLQG